MTVSRKISRRRLLRQALGAGIGLPLFISCRREPASGPSCPAGQPVAQELNANSPNEQIGVGIIGCGRRNGQLAIGKGGQGVPPDYARVVAVADLNIRRARAWAKHYECPFFDDYQKLLERKDVDVVVYATPEHSHYLPCIRAAQAGKDIYGEQPLSHAIREGRVMVDAVRKHKVVFQTGEQQRSDPKARKAVELIRNGRIGKIQSIIAYNQPSPFECNFPAQPVPAELDWDRWCGASEVVPYNVNLYVSRAPYEPGEEYPPESADKGLIIIFMMIKHNINLNGLFFIICLPDNRDLHFVSTGDFIMSFLLDQKGPKNQGLSEICLISLRNFGKT